MVKQALYILRSLSAPLLILYAVFTPQTVCADEFVNHGLGKLEIRSQAIGQSLRLTLPMLIPNDISEGMRAYLGATWTNVWAKDEEFVLDYEMLDTLLAFGYGFNKNWGVGLFIDHRAYFGGAMDSVIEDFHDVFGIEQDGRDLVAGGRNVIETYDPSSGTRTASISADELSNTGLNAVLNYNFEFTNPKFPSFNVYGVTRYALESPNVFNNEGNLDFGAGAGVSKRWFEQWYTHAVLGYTWYADSSNAEPGNVVFDDTQLTALLALSWQYSHDFALMAQYLYASAVIESFEELNKPSHEVHLGFRLRISERYMIDCALIENIITMDNSPDFGVHFGLNVQF